MRKHTTLGRLPDKRRIRPMQKHDNRARRLMNNLVNQLQRMLRARTQTHQRNIRPLPGSNSTNILNIDLTSDHLMTKRSHNRHHKIKTILTLISDQNPQMIGPASL